MKTPKIYHYLYASFFAVVLIVVGAALAHPRQEPAQSKPDDKTVRLIPSLDGHDLYHAYCASCHGVEAQGNGPAAPALKTPPPDLTTIAKYSGGFFPRRRIAKIIAGDDLIIAHGSSEMPVWGPIFHQVERDRDFGNVRMKNLVDYLETIQKK